MASSILNSDDGVISGTSGIKAVGGDDGVLVFQSKGTETARINTDKQIVAAAGTASLPIYSTTGDLNTGIYFPAADNIGFATGGTIRGRWTTDGLCFGSDTAAANALDDYEEGTFTTTITGSSSGSGAVTSTTHYTKIGNLVFVYVSISNQTFPSFVGNITCSLPFTVKSGANPKGTDCYFFPLANWDTLSNFTGFVPQATSNTATTLFPYMTVDGDRQNVLTNSNTNVSGQANLYLNFTLVYVAA